MLKLEPVAVIVEDRLSFNTWAAADAITPVRKGGVSIESNCTDCVGMLVKLPAKAD